MRKYSELWMKRCGRDVQITDDRIGGTLAPKPTKYALAELEDLLDVFIEVNSQTSGVSTYFIPVTEHLDKKFEHDGIYWMPVLLKHNHLTPKELFEISKPLFEAYHKNGININFHHNYKPFKDSEYVISYDADEFVQQQS